MNVELDPRIAVTLKVAGSGGAELDFDAETGRIAGRGTKTGTSIVISAQVSDPAIAGVRIDGHEVVAVRREAEKKFLTFAQRVYLKKGSQGMMVNFKTNRLRLAEVVAGNKILLHQYAVVIHRGKPFLTGGVQRSAELFRTAEGELVLPTMPWPQLVTVLSDLIDETAVPSIDKFTQPAEDYTRDLVPHTARVIWYDPALGQGAVVTAAGTPASVLADSFNSWRDEPIRLYPGQVIQYGACVSNPSYTSKFDYVLVSVRPEHELASAS